MVGLEAKTRIKKIVDFYDKLIKVIIIVLIWIFAAILIIMGTVLVMSGGYRDNRGYEEYQHAPLVHAGRYRS